MAYAIGSFVYNSFIRVENQQAFNKLRSQGAALITGASFGIGSGFAKELARRKFDLILIARTKSKLEELKEDLEKNHGINVQIIAFDFSNGDYTKLESELKGAKVSLLVNNVGMYTEYMKFFGECTEQESIDMIKINTIAPTQMTRILLPQMLERKSGVIINVSSQSSVYDITTPLFSVYSATKAFNRKFSTSLNAEYGRDGIQSLCITPAFVTSNMTKIRRSGGVICDEITLARESLKYVGSSEEVVSPWYRHEIQKMLSIFVCQFEFGRKMVLDWSKGKRLHAIKKLEEKKKMEK